MKKIKFMWFMLRKRLCDIEISVLHRAKKCNSVLRSLLK